MRKQIISKISTKSKKLEIRISMRNKKVAESGCHQRDRLWHSSVLRGNCSYQSISLQSGILIHSCFFFLVSVCLFFTALPSSIEFDEFWHDGLRDQRVLSRHLPLLRHAHVLRLALDAGPVHEERIVENHEVVVEDTKLITLKISKRKQKL